MAVGRVSRSVMMEEGIMGEQQTLDEMEKGRRDIPAVPSVADDRHENLEYGVAPINALEVCLEKAGNIVGSERYWRWVF